MPPNVAIGSTPFHEEWGVLWQPADEDRNDRVELCSDEDSAWRLHGEHQDDTTVVYRVVSEWRPEPEPVWRTVAMCQTCWHHEYPRRVRLHKPTDADEVERCHWCNSVTASDIYVRARVKEAS